MDSQLLAIELGPHGTHSKEPGSINSCLRKTSRPAGGQMGTRQRHEEEEEDKDERITSQASQRPHRAIHLERGDHLLLTVRPWPPHTTHNTYTHCT